jgi:hypothetical protein
MLLLVDFVFKRTLYLGNPLMVLYAICRVMSNPQHLPLPESYTIGQGAWLESILLNFLLSPQIDWWQRQLPTFDS